jgi:Tfp pilus assembly protein PilO
MVISKRERYIVVITIGLLILLAVNHFVVDPLLEQRWQDQDTAGKLRSQREKDAKLIALSQQIAPRWNAMRQTLRPNAAEAESQILHTIRDAAEDAGLTLSLLKPERLTEKSQLPQIAFQAAGTGGMRAVSRFLWRLETAPVPLRITEVQINSRREGVDDLSLQVRVSTLCLTPPSRSTGPANAASAVAEAKE